MNSVKKDLHRAQHIGLSELVKSMRLPGLKTPPPLSPTSVLSPPGLQAKPYALWQELPQVKALLNSLNAQEIQLQEVCIAGYQQDCSMLAKHDLGVMSTVKSLYSSLCYCDFGLGHVWADCVRGLVSEESGSSTECVSVLSRTQTDPLPCAASCSVLQPKGRLQSQWTVRINTWIQCNTIPCMKSLIAKYVYISNDIYIYKKKNYYKYVNSIIYNLFSSSM